MKNALRFLSASKNKGYGSPVSSIRNRYG